MSDNVYQYPGKPVKPLATDGGGPNNPDMEARILKLEGDISEVKGILQRVEPLLTRMDTSMRKLEIDVSRLDGRVSQLPSTIQLIGLVLAIMVAGGLIKHFLG